MNCMKCGREIPAGQVFCDSCLETMKKYPIKPDTAVQLPRNRQDTVLRKQASRRRPLSPEEQIPGLKRTIRRLRFFTALLVLVLAAVAVLAFFQLRNLPQTPEIPNYTNSTQDTNETP